MSDPVPRRELLSFLGAIKAEPDEDTPKLALADWLQEQPDPADQARGEFLRQFVRNNQLAKTDPAREDFGALTRLWNANEAAWAGRLRAAGFKVWATNHMFRWGLLFPARDYSHAAPADDTLATSEEYAWVAGVTVRAADVNAGIAFVNSALFDSLVGLRVAEAEGSAAVIGHLCGSPRGERLRSLEIAFPVLGHNQQAYGISQTNYLSKLRHLAFHRDVTTDDFGWLCSSTHLTGLRLLDLPGVGLTADAGRVFANSSGLPALTELNLGPGAAYPYNQLGAEGLRALFAGERSGRLQKLSVASNGATDAGVEALCAHPHMRNLTHLDLSGNGLTNAAAVALASVEHLNSLEHLDLTANEITNDGANALAKSPHLKNLRRLDLSASRRLGKKATSALRERYGDGVTIR